MRRLLAVPGWLGERFDRGVAAPAEPSPQALFEMVQASACHPESRLALEDGLRHVVVADHVLGYQLRGSTAFAIGGVNATGDAKRVLLSAYARLSGVRRRLVFPLRQTELRAAVHCGFSPVQVGVEGVLDLVDLRFAGKPYATVRNMRNRANRRGVQVREVDPDAHRDALTRVHDDWLQSKRPSWRMKLLVGSPSLHQPLDRRYLAAFHDGVIVSFITLLPGAPGQWGLDVMARSPASPAGTMDLLLHDAAVLLRDEGAKTLSLGACPMAGVTAHGRGRPLRALFRFLYRSRLGNQLFGFRNLFEFKQKFRPRWEPVYFAASPRLGVWSLYEGCRMWGLY